MESHCAGSVATPLKTMSGKLLSNPNLSYVDCKWGVNGKWEICETTQDPKSGCTTERTLIAYPKSARSSKAAHFPGGEKVPALYFWSDEDDGFCTLDTSKWNGIHGWAQSRHDGELEAAIKTYIGRVTTNPCTVSPRSTHVAYR